MKKTDWKILFTESFIPFLFLLAALIVSLLALDKYIENRDDITVINLNREQEESDESLSITQKLETRNIPPQKIEWYNEVNALIENKSWEEAVKKIIADGKNPQLRNPELNLTLAYLYYKTPSWKTGLELLKSVEYANNPRYYYNMGLLLSRQTHNGKEAIEYFQKFLTFKNKSYEAMMNIALLYYRQNEYKEAVKFYLKSAEISSLGRKAKACYWTAAALEKLKDKDQALKYLNLAIKLDPEFIPARVRRARLSLKDHPEKAILELEHLAKIYPDNAELYYIISSHYTGKNENDKALKWMRKGIQQIPNSRLLKSNAASLYLNINEDEKAKDLLLELIAQFPKEELYHFNLARAYYGLNDYKLAVEQYNKALELRPLYYEALINLGIVYSKLNSIDAAIQYYNRAIAMKSEDSIVYYNLGVLYSKENLFANSIDSYKRAIFLKKNYPEAWFNLAIVYSKMNAFDDAEKSYIEAIHLNSKYSSAYYNLALLYEKKDLIDKAMETISHGIKQTGDSKLMIRLAYEQKNKGEFKNALSTLEKVLQTDPENEDALFVTAEIHGVLKDFKESTKFVEKYLLLQPKSPEGRYLYLVDLFNLKAYDEANRQYEILNKLSPDFRDSKKYRTEINSKVEL
ncbi:MAG: tetratricopeptide repeat protein [Spirochaetia bacterium]|nr:tetratricopeptide repeat protein [Spirochaetia bacterium]